MTSRHGFRKRGKNATPPLLSFLCASLVAHWPPFAALAKALSRASSQLVEKTTGFVPRERKKRERERGKKVSAGVEKSPSAAEKTPPFLSQNDSLPHHASAVMIWLALLAQSFITR